MIEDGPRTDNDALIAAAQQAVRGQQIDPEKPYIVVAPDGSLLDVDLDRWREGPTRATGTHRPATLQSLIDVTSRYETDHLAVWVHPTSGKVVAVLDDHLPGGTENGPQFAEHRAELQLVHTPEWNYWIGQDGKMAGQEAFAEHIEGGLEEIAEPAGADLLEIVSTFHATTKATFKQSIRLQSGQQQLTYDEDVNATAGGKANMTVPTSIVLVLSPFMGEDPVRLFARFRFRITDGRLQLGYKIHRPELAVEAQLDKVKDTLGKEFEGRVFVGEPRD